MVKQKSPELDSPIELTHTYKLNNKEPHFCVSCDKPFTVKHFLITCIEFYPICTKYFNAKTVKELLNVASVDKIINFLKEINLFSKP